LGRGGSKRLAAGKVPLVSRELVIDGLDPLKNNLGEGRVQEKKTIETRGGKKGRKNRHTRKNGEHYWP